MRHQLLIILIALFSASSFAQNAPTDTVYNPKIIYTGMPSTYEIAGIKVTGVPNYEDDIVIGYSGLNVGDFIEIPGNRHNQRRKTICPSGTILVDSDKGREDVWRQGVARVRTEAAAPHRSHKLPRHKRR